ncbi:MAG: helix-turn-helix transcriptional regulator [Bacteroidota bacterium]
MSDNEQFLKALGHQIDKIRKEKGISFGELALRSDIDKSNLVKIVTAGKNPTVSTLYKISKGLEVTMSELFDF